MVAEASLRVILIAFLAVGQIESAIAEAPARQRPDNSLLSDGSFERQYQALAAMPAVDVTYWSNGTVASVLGDTGLTFRNAALLYIGASDTKILTALQDILQTTGTESLVVQNNSNISVTRRSLRFSQSIRRLDVLGSNLGILVDDRTGSVSQIYALLVPDVDLPRQPKIRDTTAISIVRQAVLKSGAAKQGSINVGDATLAYMASPDGRHRLVWQIRSSYITGEGQLDGLEYWVDALDGSIANTNVYIQY